MAAGGFESVVKYVGHKVSAVRWRPQPPGAVHPSDLFVSGSWDDEMNHICAWRYPPSAAPEAPAAREPELVCEREEVSSVTALQFVDERNFATGFANGSVAIFSLGAQATTLTSAQTWRHLHRLDEGGCGVSCTALAVGSGATIATGGEDGRLCLLRIEDQQPLRSIDSADNATITSLTCTLTSELLSTSSSGQLKIWDLRLPSNSPTRILVISEDCVAMQSLSRHPNQPHLVAVGRGDGSLCFWDLRQAKQPLQLLQAHSSDVWEVHFHNFYPSSLFTCSHDGSLWHWDTTQQSTSLIGQVTGASPSVPPVQQPNDSFASPWLSGGVTKGKVDVVNYLPHNRLSVNSLDIQSRHLVCGTDGEALFVIPNLTLK